MSALYGPVVQLVRTLACHARGRRFDPVPDRHNELSFRGVHFYAGIAQEVERILGKDEVTGSNPVISSSGEPPHPIMRPIISGAFVFYKYKPEP